VPTGWEGQEEDLVGAFGEELHKGKTMKEAAIEVAATDLTPAQLNQWKKATELS
jgi:hypothetical protein